MLSRITVTFSRIGHSLTHLAPRQNCWYLNSWYVTVPITEIMVNQLPGQGGMPERRTPTRPRHGPPVSHRSARPKPRSFLVGAKHDDDLTISLRRPLDLAHGRYVTVTLESLNMVRKHLPALFMDNYHYP